ncbi:C4-dicarboxylate transporter DctM subunit [Alkalibacillus filiformis]|uniref:C4-dicarboxylate transporter DctM subunit n=1 Tax=Alkalibacillus filiformis TaxID=200990 RepID=A0ABU0DV74_9BACI|nr:TRAP transporter large permease [Alkalibacillus filiformis]MDQ0352350.1 C4-dicarboxylate transporter DctM subunit [Alkalibacillus filiformis]
MTIILLFGLFFLLVLLKVPIAIAIGTTSVFVLFSIGGMTSVNTMSNIMYTSISTFTLLAIPFFILAGVIMEYAGISKRLISFAQTLVGNVRGGIVFITVITALFFAAISGSGPATVAAIGGILIPAIVKNGYRKDTAASLVASSGSIGIIVPPSIAFIVFAVVAGDQIDVTIGRLFIAGIVPGILLAIAFVITALMIKWRDDQKLLPVKEEVKPVQKYERSSLKDIGKSFLSAFWGLLIPIIILGGIYGGIFTPTEAAVVAVFYGLFIGMFVYRELSIKKLYNVFVDASVQTAVVMFIVSSASLFAYIITSERIARQIADSLLFITENPILILLLINLMLLVAGAFIDAISAFYIFVPIILPIALFLDMDPTVIGVFMTLNLAIGLFTPPVGLNLYVAAGITKLPISQVSKAILPFLIAAIVVLILVTFIPEISTFLPDLIGID